MRDLWTVWDPRLRVPEWDEPTRRVVLVLGLRAACVVPSPISVAFHAAERAGVLFIAVENEEGLRFLAEDLVDPTHYLPAGCLPALRVERQSDLNKGANALGRVPGRSRALVVSPREPIDLSKLLCPSCHNRGEVDEPHDAFAVERLGCPHCMGERLADLVVVAGFTWSMQPAWIRALRDQCRTAQVAFAFIGWGKWAPYGHFTGLAMKQNGSGHSVPAQSYLPPDGGGTLFYDIAEPGRFLDGAEHLELPEGL